MKNLHLIVWLTQLGCCAAFPPVGCIWLAVWLKNRFQLGIWMPVLGAVIGFSGAIDGFRRTLKAMEQMERSQDPQPPASFNEHE